MERFWVRLWSDERGQDVAEYATIVAVIFLIAIAGARLIGLNFNSVVSRVIDGMR
jgi:Flp pilus assembly pilin Flp